MLKWEDATRYSRDESLATRAPRAWRLKLTRDFLIWVGHEHIHYKGQWVMHCSPWFDTKDLKMSADKFSPEQAQEKALNLVRAEVAKVSAALAST